MLKSVKESRVVQKGGFTLVEVVSVLAILIVLSAISVGAYRYLHSNTKVDRARADLQVIQVGLEKYRARFGDYPKIPVDFAGLGLSPANTPEAYLLNALNGQIGPTHKVVSNIPSMLNNAVLEFEKVELPLSSLKANWIIDPWGNAYVYDYQPSLSTWEVFGYVLLSAGPNGEVGDEDDIVAE